MIRSEKSFGSFPLVNWGKWARLTMGRLYERFKVSQYVFFVAIFLNFPFYSNFPQDIEHDIRIQKEKIKSTRWNRLSCQF